MRGQPLRSRYLSIKVVALLLLFLTSDTAAQDQITVVGFEGYPLAYVTATVGDEVLSGDVNGRIYIPAQLQYADTLTIDYMGYISLKTTVATALRDSIIELVPNTAATVTIIGRTDRPADRIIGEVDIIRKEQIQLSQAQTTADALEANANVYVQRSQMGGGSPVLRGFEANRVLLVSDGVRMNNAIYRSGHLQNAISVDPHLLEQIEVIYGPGALMYGSDALGGVIHFRSQEPRLRLQKTDRKFSLTAFQRYASVNNESTSHVNLNYGGKWIAGITSISHSDFRNLRSGKYHRYNEVDDPDYGLRLLYQDGRRGDGGPEAVNDDPLLQIGTGYPQVNLGQQLKIQLSKFLSISSEAKISYNLFVPRYDQLQLVDDQGLVYSRWSYGNEWALLSVNVTSTRRRKLWDKITLRSNRQFVYESRSFSRFDAMIDNSQRERVRINGLTLDASKATSEQLTIRYGLQVRSNSLNSRAARDQLTRYSDGPSSLNSQGVYFLAEHQKDKHNLQAGLRYSRQQVGISYEDSIIVWPSNYYEGVTNNTNALTGSIAHKYTAENWTISTTLGTAFRAPNIDDLAKIRVKRDEVTIPNLDLKPERSLTAEVNLGYQASEGLHTAVTTFYTRLSNAIVQAPAALPDGSTTLLQGSLALITVANTNAAAADIAGISLSGRYVLNPSLRIQGNVSYTRGWQYLEGEASPLSHIPPLYGRLGITYDQDQWTASAQLRFNGSKPLDQYGGSVDNIELATPVGTPAWYVIDLSAQRRLGDCWQLEVGIDNLLNRFYRPFASGVNGPGFGVIAGLRFSF